MPMRTSTPPVDGATVGAVADRIEWQLRSALLQGPAASLRVAGGGGGALPPGGRAPPSPHPGRPGARTLLPSPLAGGLTRRWPRPQAPVPSPGLAPSPQGPLADRRTRPPHRGRTPSSPPLAPLGAVPWTGPAASLWTGPGASPRVAGGKGAPFPWP